MSKARAFSLRPMSDEWLEEFSMKVQAYRATISDRTPHNFIDPESLLPVNTHEEKYQALVDVAKKHALKMSRKNVDFFAAATQKLVTTVLQREFGNSITQSQQFSKMKSSIASTILKTPRYRQALEGLFDILDKTQQQPEAIKPPQENPTSDE